MDGNVLINSRPPQGDEIEDTRPTLAKYLDWQRRQVARLGVVNWTDDVKPDNAVLKAALAKIAASGAPDPVVVRETAWTPAGLFEVDLYVFTSPQNPRLQWRSGEHLLAVSPDVVINELKAAGIRRM